MRATSGGERPGLRGIRRAAVLIGLLGIVLGVGLIGGTGTASAHAVLESTDPADGAVLGRAPNRVLLHFGESVTVVPDAVRVYDGRLHEVDRGRAGHLTGRPDVVGVRLDPRMAPGTYTVTWRVVSADSHPVSGGFRFSIGHPSAAAATARTAGPSTSGAAAKLMSFSRWLGYAGAALGLGSAAVLLVWWPSGRRDRRARLLITAGWGLLAIGSLGQLSVQGPYAVAAPITQLADAGLLAGTISTSFGQVLLARLGLLVLLAAWLALALTRRTRRRRLVGGSGLFLGLAVLATMSLAGHASTGTLVPLSVASDLAHLAAMTLWLGGLALLVVCLLARRRANELAAVLPGFSRLATACVAALVITGGYQSWRDVRYLPAFVDTTYGLLLTAKIAVFLLLLGFGALARRWVRRHYLPAARPGLFSPRVTAHAAGPDTLTDAPAPSSTRTVPAPGAIRALRRGLAAETLIGVAVLVLTAVLVGTAQAKETYTPAFHTQVVTTGQQLRITAEPAHTGTTTLTVTLHDRTGAAIPLREVHGSLSLPSRHVGPLPVAFHRHHNGARARATFPAAGTWTLDLAVRTSPTSATTYQVHIPVIG